MADTFRIQIKDQTGPGPIEDPKEQSSQGKAPSGNRPLDTSGPSTAGGKINTKDSGSNAISLSSNSSKSPPSSYKVSSSTQVTNNDDIFSENASNNYTNTDIQNTEELISSGSEYGRISNIIAESLEASMSDTLGTYSAVKDVQQNTRDGAAALLYGMLKEAIQNGSSNNSASTSGGSSGSAYTENDDAITTGSNATASTAVNVGGGIGAAANSLSVSFNSFNPDTSLLKVADSLLDSFEGATDYSNVKYVSDDVPGTGNDYSSSGISFDFDSGEQMTEWETMTYPDAMSNMYDVYFRVRNEDGEDKSLKAPHAILKALFDNDLLSARITSIEIPAFQRQTAVVSWQGASVEKPLDGVETPGQSSFTIRGDTRLYYVAAFNELAGTGLSNFFGKGSALVDKLNKNAIETLRIDKDTKIKALNELAEEYRAAFKEDYEKAKAEAAREDLSGTLADYMADNVDHIKELTDFYTQAYTDWKDGKASSYYASPEEYIYETLAKNFEETLNSYSEKEKTAIEDIDKENLNLFNIIQEKRKIRRDIKSQERVTQSYFDKLQEYRKSNTEATDKVTAAYEAKKKEFEEGNEKAIAQINNEYTQALRVQNLKAIEMEKDNFDYITTSLNKSISIVAAQVKAVSNDEDKDKLSDDANMIKFLQSYKHLDIIVKRVTPSNRFRTTLSEKKDERFIFEDVKILGTSTPISFKREDANIQEFTYNFIYKRFYKEDIYDQTGEWVKSQTEQFYGKVLNQVSGLLENKLSVNEFSDKIGDTAAKASGMKNYSKNIESSFNNLKSSGENFTSVVKAIKW